MNVKKRSLIFTLILFTFGCNYAQIKKNVVMIVVDDLKPLLPIYGYDFVHAPNFNWLSKSGITFTNAYAQQALCGPSRVSILTGLYPNSTGVHDLQTKLRAKNPNLITLMQLFKQNGYLVTGAGKVFDGRNVDNKFDSLSWSEGFLRNIPRKYYDPTWGKGFSSLGYHDSEVRKHQEALELYEEEHGMLSRELKKKLFPRYRPSTECIDLPDDAYMDGALANFFMAKLNGLSSRQPFFLTCGFKKPHLPFVAPKQYWNLYDRDSILSVLKIIEEPNLGKLVYPPNIEAHGYSDIPEVRNLPDTIQARLIHGYLACISYIDQQIGKILKVLEEQNLVENTVIVVLGDHGFHLGDHALWGKHTNLEQAVKTPLIIVDPSVIKSQMINSSMIEFVDIFPTLADLVNIDFLGVEGRSLMPILQGKSQKVRETALSQYPRNYMGGSIGFSLRDSIYRFTKWIKVNDEMEVFSGSFTLEEQLFDLVNDPEERINLANNFHYDSVRCKFLKDLVNRNILVPEESCILNEIIIYPNPVGSNSYLEIINKGYKKLEVLDVNGKIVKSCFIPEVDRKSNYRLWVGDLRTGIYLIRITDREGISHMTRIIR